MTVPISRSPGAAGQDAGKADQGSLVRALGPVDASMLVVGGIIGSGIFLAPSIVARTVGSPRLSLAAWVAGGLLALCGAVCYAELGAAIPETGGTYAFLRRAYRTPLIGFLYAWSFFFVSATGAIAALGSAFATYAMVLLRPAGGAPVWAVPLVAAGAIGLLSAINCIGVRRGGHLQTFLTLLKLGVLVGIVIAGVRRGSGGQFLPVFPSPASTARTWSAFGAALIPVLFAYSGWPLASYVAGEIRDPQRNIPLATIGGLLAVIAIYLAINVAYLAVLPFSVLAHSTVVASDAMQRAVGPGGAIFVAVAVVLSTAGALNAAILGYPRVGFALAADRLFPAWLRRVHPRYHTPVVAIAVQGGLAMVFAVSGSYERILGYFAFVDYFFFAFAVAAVIVLRVREPELPRPYRVWGYPFTPLIFLGIAVAYLANLLGARLGGSMVGIVLTLAGIPFYWWWRRHQLAVADVTGSSRIGPAR